MHVQRRQALSDQNNTNAELEEQVRLLKNALKREQNAKRKLEAKLEEKLQHNFEENQAFLQAYENANSRQIQLHFLSSLTSDILSITNIEKMLAHFLGNISVFLEPCTAIVLSKDTQQLKLSRLNTSSNTFDPISEQSLNAFYTAMDTLALSEQWQRLNTSNSVIIDTLHQYAKHDTTLVYPLRLTQNKFRYLFLDINHYCYSEDFKRTLNTASKQFSIAIQRLITEVELAYNYQKLKSTLEQLKSTQRQLIHSEKMASLGQLSAGVAHEINNPLGYIASNFQVLEEYCQSFENTFLQFEKSNDIHLSKQVNFARKDIPELLASCIKGISRISDIVMSLKTFSKKDTGDFHETNINNVIENSLKIVVNQFKYSHQIKTELLPDIPLINACEGQLQQVFINLFINAAQAMKQKGTLTITTKASEHYVEASISDTGSGMAQTTIAKLFEPFYTTKQNHGGTGLGLSVSYAIIERHQAQIEVESELGVGSCFTLKFPLLKI